MRPHLSAVHWALRDSREEPVDLIVKHQLPARQRKQQQQGTWSTSGDARTTGEG